MKKLIVLCMIAILACSFCLLAACSSGGEAPVTSIEFASLEDITLSSSFDSESVDVHVYPADADVSDITLTADIEGYVEIEKMTRLFDFEERPYVVVSFSVSPIYNGTVKLTASSQKYSVSTTTSITVIVENADDMPVTDSSEKALLTRGGWSEAMISSFVSVRTQTGTALAASSLTESNGAYTFIGADKDTYKVVFENEEVSSLYDCNGERKIYPNNGVILTAEKLDDSKAALRANAEKIVRDRLTYPLTADFPLFAWVYNLDTESCDTAFVVSSVTAKNAFGVPIEMTFAIEYKFDKQGNFTWQNMMIDTEFYTNPNA